MDSKKKAKPIACTVVSDKGDKSRVAVLGRLVKHPRYNKYIRRQSRMMFHDETNQSKVGDKVLIEPSRPYSARKRFCLLKIVEAAQAENL